MNCPRCHGLSYIDPPQPKERELGLGPTLHCVHCGHIWGWPPHITMQRIANLAAYLVAQGKRKRPHMGQR